MVRRRAAHSDVDVGRPDDPAPPLRPLLPVITVAGLYAIAALVWIAFGSVLPGGRWLAVHLFTVGVLTNVVVALTHHFAQTLLHTPERSVRVGRIALLNVGAVLLVVGLPSGLLPVFVSGATALTVAVCWLYVDLRSLRRTSLGGRFVFMVRGYERACGAFVHGALLGVFMGAGLLGAWHGAARLAHLHVNALGWGGLTLLATMVFFGPTIMRTRIESGADIAAATALPRAATGLTIAAVALLLTGAGGAVALPARLLAAVALSVYAVAATTVCRAVLQAGRRARPSASTWLLRAACVWFVAVVWADVLVVATGRFRLLDALGAVLVVGVLGQAILAALGYLLPMARSSGPEARAAARARLDRLPRVRPAALNLGVALVAAAAIAGTAAGPLGAAVARTGWTLVAAAVLTQLLLMAAAPRRASAR